MKDYLEFLVWKDKNRNQPAKNPVARKIIKAMKEPPHLAEEDVSALLQVIDEGKQPTRFESPLDGIKESVPSRKSAGVETGGKTGT